MAILYTRQTFINRIKKHMNDGYPNDSYPVSENEMMLYLDQAIAFQIVGQSFQNAKVENALIIPDAYLITYALATLQQDTASGNYYTTLPQPPLSLPVGYSINQVFILDATYGKMNFRPAKSKRLSFRENLPKPEGGAYWVENTRIWLAANDNSSLVGFAPYVQMPSARTTDITQTMNVPDDALEAIFISVVGKLKERFGIPKDIVHDDLPAGNKGS